MLNYDHYAYLSALLMCGTCGRSMDKAEGHDMNYKPYKAKIQWIVKCSYPHCPYFGIPYVVIPSVPLVKYEGENV